MAVRRLVVFRCGLCLAFVDVSKCACLRLEGRTTPSSEVCYAWAKQGISLDKVAAIKAHLVPVWLRSPEWPCLCESRLMIFMCWERKGPSLGARQRGCRHLYKWIRQRCATLGRERYPRHSTHLVITDRSCPHSSNCNVLMKWGVETISWRWF